MTSALYRRVLGSAFAQLPPALQAFHDIDREKTFTAHFRITRGGGWLRNFICWLGGLPPAGENVPMRLRVAPDGEAEVWHRAFGTHQLTSVQRLRDGLMVESFGPIRLGFRLLVEQGTLRLQLEKAWVLGIRWPLFLAPGGTGVETAQTKGCAIVATATAPLLGMLVRYEGLVRAAETPIKGVPALE